LCSRNGLIAVLSSMVSFLATHTDAATAHEKRMCLLTHPLPVSSLNYPKRMVTPWNEMQRGSLMGKKQEPRSEALNDASCTNLGLYERFIRGKKGKCWQDLRT
jgi:hypothetical protein